MEELWAKRGAIKKGFHKLMTGGSREVNATLDEIQETLDACPEHDKDANLDVVREAAQGVCAVHAAANAKSELQSKKVLKRCEDLRDLVVSNLETRMVPDLLRGEDSTVIVKKVLDVSKELDALGADKSSSFIEAKVRAVQEKMVLPQLEDMDRAMEQLQEPMHVIPASQSFLTALVSAQAELPKSIMVAEILLKRCSALLVKLVKVLPQALTFGLTVATESREVAARLDAVAEGLAAICGGTWASYAISKVDPLAQAEAIKRFTEHMVKVKSDLANRSVRPDLAAIVQSLVDLQPWWRFVAGVPEVGERLSAIYREVDARVISTIWQAATAGDMARVDTILDASQSYDSCRVQFVGAGITEGSLRTKLMDVFADVGKRLDAVEALVASALLIDSTITTKILDALEALVTPMWTAAAKTNPALPEQLSRSVAVIEARAQESFAAVGRDITHVTELLRFADRCDALCQRLHGLEALGRGSIGRTLRRQAVAACLRAVEAEASRGSVLALDPTAHALEELWRVPTMERIATDDITRRVEALAPLLKSALIARMAAADVASADMVWKCARMADGALAAALVKKDGAAFCDILIPVMAVCEKLNSARDELGKSSGMSPDSIAKALDGLKPVWHAVADVREFQSSIREISSLLISRMRASFDKASAAKSQSTMDLLLRYASEYDAAFEGLGFSFGLCEALRPKVLPVEPTVSELAPPATAVAPTTSAAAPICSAVVPSVSAAAVAPTVSELAPPATAVAPTASAMEPMSSAVVPSVSAAAPTMSAVVPTLSAVEPPQSSFCPPPRHCEPPTATRFEAAAKWGGDSPRLL